MEDFIRLEVLRNRLGRQVNVTDADISMDQLRSEGLRRWNTDMDIEYQYDTFNGMPVYYGGDRYDSDDSDEFFPDTSEEMNNRMRNQSRPDHPDGGHNNSVNTVDVTPKCRTVSDEPGREVFDYTADEYSDTSKTETVDLDDTNCQLETDIWDDTYCPVWIYDPSMVNSTGQAEQLLLNKGEVACMSDFDDEDFNDTDVDSDAGSDMEFEWNTWKSEHFLSYPVTDIRTQAGATEIVCYREDKNIPEEDVCCTDTPSVNWATGYIDSARYIVPLCLLERPCQRDVDVRCMNNANDWNEEHGLTVAWCVNAEDSSYIEVCYDCLWLIDNLRI